MMASQGHILDGDTLALWRLDEAAPGTYSLGFLDSRLAAEHLALVGGPIGVCSGPAGSHFARCFDGAQYGARAGDMVGDLTFRGAAWTIGCWVWLASLPATSHTRTIISYSKAYAPGSATIVVDLRVNDAGRLELAWHYDAATLVVDVQSAGTALTAGTWHFVQVSSERDPTQAYRKNRFYIDRTLQHTGPWVSMPFDPAGAAGYCVGACLGVADTAVDEPWIGALKSLCVSSGLSGVHGIASDAVAPSYSHDDVSPAVFHWSLSESPDVIDESPNGQHLILSGVSPVSTYRVPGLIQDYGNGATYFSWGALLFKGFLSNPSHALLTAATQDAWACEAWIRLGDEFWWAGGAVGLLAVRAPMEAGLARLGVDFSGGDGVDAHLTLRADNGVGVDGHDVTLMPCAQTFRLHHVAFNMWTDAGLSWMETFLDGELVHGPASFTLYAGCPTATLWLGAGYKLGEEGCTGFYGTVDDVRVSRKRRTATEILTSYQRGPSRILIPLRDSL